MKNKDENLSLWKILQIQKSNGTSIPLYILPFHSETFKPHDGISSHLDTQMSI